MGSSKKQTVGHKYFVGFHAVLGYAGNYLRRIWIEDKEAWYGGVGNQSSRISKPNLFGGDDSGGGIAGDFNYYIGTKDQQPDPYLEKVLGKGNVPAYRGVSSFVWKQGWIGNSNYMKEWKYRVSYVNGINSNVTNVPSNFVFAFDCSKSLSANDFVRLKNTLNELANTLIFFKENYFNAVMNVRVIAFDATVEYLDLIDFQVDDAARFDEFIRSREQVSGVSFSEMLSTGYEFFSQNSSAKRNTFCIVADGKDVTASHTATARAHFDTVRHFCLYTQFIKDAANGDLPDHIALSSLDNTPEDSWFRSTLALGGHWVCPWVWTSSGDALIDEEAWFGIRTGEPDMNPADMLWLCITNDQWGLGQPEETLDKEAFLEAWRVLKQEDMYMSLVFDDEGQIQNIINLICEHIDASCYVDKQTGKWTVKLIRDDYEVESLVTLDGSNVAEISDYEIRTAAEQINQVTVTYWNKETGKNATTSAHDPARIAQNGLINKPVEYDGFTNEKTAFKAAERDLKALSSPLKTVTLNGINPDVGRLLSVGDAFTWNWEVHGVDGAVMRVKEIDYGDAYDLSVKIQAIEDVFSTPMNSVAPYIPPYVNPIDQPALDNPTVRIIELPYFDAVQMSSEGEVNAQLQAEPTLSKVAVVAAKNQLNAINADVYTGQGQFSYKGQMDYCPSAILVHDISELDTILHLEDGQDLDLVLENEWLLLGNEKLAVVSIDLATSELIVKRGVLGTIPAKHNQGQMLYFCDQYMGVDPTDYFANESVSVKLLTNTSSDQLSQLQATTHSIQLVGEAYRPYPPANVKINGEYWPSLVRGNINLSWSHRNRLQQTGGTPLGWYYAEITAEEGTLYVVNLYNSANELLVSKTTELNSIIINQDEFVALNVRLEIISVRDEYECSQKFRHEFAVESAVNQLKFTAPYSRPNSDNIVLRFEE